MFHYRNGENVKVGDLVRVWHGSGWVLAVVKMIFEPNTEETRGFGCPEEGGVLIEEDWRGADQCKYRLLPRA